MNDYHGGSQKLRQPSIDCVARRWSAEKKVNSAKVSGVCLILMRINRVSYEFLSCSHGIGQDEKRDFGRKSKPGRKVVRAFLLRRAAFAHFKPNICLEFIHKANLSENESK